MLTYCCSQLTPWSSMVRVFDTQSPAHHGHCGAAVIALSRASRGSQHADGALMHSLALTSFVTTQPDLVTVAQLSLRCFVTAKAASIQ